MDTTQNPNGGAGISTAKEPGAEFDQTLEVQAAANSLLDKAKDSPVLTDLAAAVEKAAAALKAAAEIQKTRIESEKLTTEMERLRHENENAAKRDRSERIRDYVALLTPLVTIITLAATLVAQNWQFLRSERDKRDDALDTQWQDSVKTISASGALSAGLVALQPFLNSPKYGEQAREVAVNLLANSSDPAFFTSLFGTALVPVTKTNIDRVIRLDRALLARVNPVWAKTWDETKQKDDTKKLSKEELATFNYMDGAFPVITSEIGGLLKARSMDGWTVDFSATFFKNGDWQGVNLAGADLTNARLIWTDLTNARLDGVRQFAGADFYRTIWWHARSINRPLLDYLMEKYPFKQENDYGPRDTRVSQAEYDRAIHALMSH